MTTEINRRRREGGTLYLLKNLKNTYYMGYDPVAKKVTTTKDPYKAYPFLNEGSCKAFLGHIQNGMNKMHTYRVSGFRFEGIDVQADQPFGSFFKKAVAKHNIPAQILQVANDKIHIHKGNKPFAFDWIGGVDPYKTGGDGEIALIMALRVLEDKKKSVVINPSAIPQCLANIEDLIQDARYRKLAHDILHA
jgi:hypothetical protein